jgi:hypothetical protein
MRAHATKAVLTLMTLLALFCVQRAEAASAPIANDQTVEVPSGSTFLVYLDWTMGSGIHTHFHVLTQPLHGVLGARSTDSFWFMSYTPDPGYSGPDSFTWNITEDDTATTSNTATCTLDVAVPDPSSLRLLTVTDGSGDGSYVPGTIVTVIADPAPAGKEFSYWSATGDFQLFASGNSPTTTLEMPANSLTVYPVYQPTTGDGGGGDGGDGSGGGTSSSGSGGGCGSGSGSALVAIGLALALGMSLRRNRI